MKVIGNLKISLKEHKKINIVLGNKSNCAAKSRNNSIYDYLILYTLPLHSNMTSRERFRFAYFRVDLGLF